MAASPEAKFTEEKVLWIKHHTPKLMTFAISRPESYRFSAGQFSRLGFRDGEGFIAVSPEARKTFWLDRSRTAAIAKHTNAFKINEDVVIPLERLGEYSDGIERINIELSIQNKLTLCAALEQYLSGKLPIDKMGTDLPTAELLGERGKHALAHVSAVKERWDWLLANLDTPLADYKARYGAAVHAAPEAKDDESCLSLIHISEPTRPY